MLTGSPTLHRRLPSLCMQARSLGYSTVWANRAGSQSTNKLRHCCLSLGWDGFPSEPVILLDHLNQSSSNLIIQGWDGFPSEPVILLDHLNQSSSNLIIQGWDGFPSEPVILLDHLNQSSSNLIIRRMGRLPQ